MVLKIGLYYEVACKQFFRNPEKIESEDEGMNDAQTLWSKISADVLDNLSSC